MRFALLALQLVLLAPLCRAASADKHALASSLTPPTPKQTIKNGASTPTNPSSSPASESSWTATVTAKATLSDQARPATVNYTGYLNGNSKLPVPIHNVTAFDCSRPDPVSGSGMLHASCCSSVIYSARAYKESWGAFIYPHLFNSTIITKTRPASKLVKGPESCPLDLTYLE